MLKINLRESYIFLKITTQLHNMNTIIPERIVVQNGNQTPRITYSDLTQSSRNGHHAAQLLHYSACM